MTRGQVVFLALFLCYMVVYALVVNAVGLPLGFITMYVFGLVAAALYVLQRRRTSPPAPKRSDRRPGSGGQIG